MRFTSTWWSHCWGMSAGVRSVPGNQSQAGIVWTTCYIHLCRQFHSAQSLSRVRLFATPWTAARQASLSITNSQSLLKLMSIESVMPSNHLILLPLLLLPSIFPCIRVFSNESVLHIRWPNYWSFSFNINLSNEYSGLISFRMDWLDLLAVQGTLKSLLQHHSSKASIPWCSAFCDFKAPKNSFPIYFPWSDETRCHDLSFLMLSFKPGFSLSSFTFIKRLFSSSLSAIRVVLSACCYLVVLSGVIWSYWYFSWQSWFPLVLPKPSVSHDVLCI